MKTHDYLKLMEEHTSKKGNLFEKVIITSKRAKSLYELDESTKASFGHKPTFQAILETNEGKIKSSTVEMNHEEVKK